MRKRIIGTVAGSRRKGRVEKERQKVADDKFKYLTHIHIEELAAAANCDESYVRKIIRGDRAAKSTTARAILRAAKALNETIKKGLTKSTKDLQSIDGE